MAGARFRGEGAGVASVDVFLGKGLRFLRLRAAEDDDDEEKEEEDEEEEEEEEEEEVFE